MEHKWREIRRASAFTWILWWEGQLELRQIHALLCLHAEGHFDHQRYIHIAGADDTAMTCSCIFVCVCLYQIVCVFDLAAVYLCGCVAIWSYRLFVLGRMDTGGNGPLAACCLCDSLSPVSALTHTVMTVWTRHLLLSFQSVLRFYFFYFFITISMLVSLKLCVLLSGFCWSDRP